MHPKFAQRFRPSFENSFETADVNLGTNMNRVTRQVLSHISSIKKETMEKLLSKLCRREVNIGATGTQEYRLKKGPNRGKVLHASK